MNGRQILYIRDAFSPIFLISDNSITRIGYLKRFKAFFFRRVQFDVEINYEFMRWR